MSMSMRMAFPRAGAGFSAKRHRYDELADTFKVVKEEVEKEMREKRKEWWRHNNNKWNNKKSEGAKYTPPTWKKRRHFAWEPKYDHDYYYRSSASFNSTERRRRRRQRRRDEHEIKPFERRSCSLMSSWEKKKVPALPVATTTSVYANKTNKEEEELSSSSETSTSSNSCGINVCGINDEETTNKRSSSWCLEKEELEYKKLELELQKMVPLYAASLPPLDLDWLCPKTTTNKDERRAEKQRKISLSLSSSDADQINRSLSLGPPHAQYLHHLHIFALPYVLPF